MNADNGGVGCGKRGEQSGGSENRSGSKANSHDISS
jgi:hypothetical protein